MKNPMKQNYSKYIFFSLKHKAGRVLFFLLMGLTLLQPWAFAERTLVEDNIPLSDSMLESRPSSWNESSSSNSNQPRVGRAAAQKYFVKEPQYESGINTRLLSLHIGGYLKSRAHQWGSQPKSQHVGLETMGVTYKIGEWTRTMDLNLRVDYFQYQVDQEKPIKVSFLPLLTFPDAATNFPLYFGMGAGVGLFLNQLERESSLSLDYQLIFGFRWTDLWNRGGIFIESGIKDHFHLLSDGQFSSQFLTAGAVFKL